ncbi:secretory pathway Sec39 [Aureobasidium subglaciale]|nr:secretory pathway Sec39 [Aureobasidium subglaciale]KAI5213520.1 secretory pathway Sec39 [Aureobasidium subglaciale]KAI5215164.1 secretory pathway Sec39 [Aureobasidium subglaciale]KAI5256447.1 secretory pathway Sec39 [Aureobasidium subglaciale]
MGLELGWAARDELQAGGVWAESDATYSACGQLVRMRIRMLDGNFLNMANPSTKALSSAHCILLTVHYASEANIRLLHAFTPSRPDVLSPELVLRIVLTYLPETVDPSLYTTYVREVATRIDPEQRELLDVDTSPVSSLSPDQARRRVNKLFIQDLSPPAFPPHAPNDLLTRFIVHRANRIDNETGLLTLVPRLAEPFLDTNPYLRTWYVAVVLPLLRLRYDYYPETQDPPALSTFEKLDGHQGIDLLLSNVTNFDHDMTSPTDSKPVVARDTRAMVGPWMYGHTERKRRRLYHKEESRREQHNTARSPHTASTRPDASTNEDKTGHDWEYLFEWMLHTAIHDFSLVANLVEQWDGPGDVDLGGFQDAQAYLDDDTQAKLERQYAQATFASCYAAEADSPETIADAHAVLVRLAHLLDFGAPPQLATSVKQLPIIDKHIELLYANGSTVNLEPNVLLDPDHPLATPTLDSYMLLQLLVYSAYQLAGLGHNISILTVAKLRFASGSDEQLSLLTKVIHSLAAQGKRDEQQWQDDYDRLIWLWNWNTEIENPSLNGAGIFGRLEKATIEREFLKVLVSSGSYPLVDRLYFAQADARQVSAGDIEKIILEQAMQLYDNASNGNRTRGNMKKSQDLIVHCQGQFPQSDEFKKALALIAATHSMSFYSLKLQHGVPFQPVNIRASLDPLSLLPKLLEQNANSYTKLDDLIEIGRNLIAAGLPLRNADGDLIDRSLESDVDKKTKLSVAEKRVIYMCVEAALTVGDFETAYSYVVNRLAPQDTIPSSVSEAEEHPEMQEDDVSWRAAFLAGRYRSQTNAQPTLRRLDQRTELLSLALLLAPPSSLSEVLNIWRRCEEETNALLAAETQAEEEFDDRADKRISVPGGFSDASTEGMVFGQPRREVGRSNAEARRGADEEAPMGLFDVARGAAKAFSRNAFPLRGGGVGVGGAASAPQVQQQQQLRQQPTMQAQRAATGEGLHEGMDDGRVRRRDMITSTVTGGLASGIGWMLGATPVDRSAEDRR